MASTITPTTKDLSAKEIEDEFEFTTIQPDFESKVKMPRRLDGTIESKTELSDDETAFEMTTLIPELPIEILTAAKINHIARYDDDIPIISSPEIDLLVDEYEDSFVEGNTMETLVENSLPPNSQPTKTDSFYTQESNTELPYHEAETMTLVQENLDLKPESTTIEPNLIKNDKKPRPLHGVHKSSSELSDDKISFDNESETTTFMPELVSDKIKNVSRTLKPNEEIKVNKLILTGPYFGPYLVPFVGSFFGLHYHTWNLNQSSKIHNEKVNNGTRLTDNDKNSGPQMGTLSAHYGPYFGIYYLPYYGWYYLLTHNIKVESEDPDIELLPDDYLIDLNNKPSFASK